MIITQDRKVRAIREVMAGQTQTRVARKYRIHAVTLCRWIKRFRQMGAENFLKCNLRGHSARPSTQARDKQICQIKESEPGITLAKAKARLRQSGVSACPATIRRIWSEYGYTGFCSSRPADQRPLAADERRLLAEARRAVADHEPIRNAARLVNELKSCPDHELLLNIPDRYLSLPHRLEKLDAACSVDKMAVQYRHARDLRRRFEREKQYYSMLRAGMNEVFALDHLNYSHKGLRLINRLQRLVPGGFNRCHRFKLLVKKGRFYTDLLMIKEAVECTRQCGHLLKSLKQHRLKVELSHLHASLGEYGKAAALLEKAISGNAQRATVNERISQAAYYAMGGKYRIARGMIRNLAEPDGLYKTLCYATIAACEIGSGNPERALEFSQKAIAHARRDGLVNYLHASLIIQASAYAALGFADEARHSLRKIMPLLSERKVLKSYFIHAALAGNTRISKKYRLFPPINLLLLLKKAGRSGRPENYEAAYSYASNKGLLGIFHRYCLLAPAAIAKLLNRGRSTRLPRAILNLPIFNKEIPSFRLDFLGPLRIYRKEKLLNVKLPPKDAAFFIHLLMARDYRRSLDECLRNFWPRARDPKNNLYHLLRRLRRQLMIPAQYLFVRKNFIYYTGGGITDYAILQGSLTLARTLDGAQKWSWANREYERAFQLVRAEPFHKIYDPWSDELRTRILSQVETAVVDYAGRGQPTVKDAEAVKQITRILSVLPGSQACADSLKALRYSVSA